MSVRLSRLGRRLHLLSRSDGGCLVIGTVQLFSSITSGEGPRLVLPQLMGILLLAEELMQLQCGNETSAALSHTRWTIGVYDYLLLVLMSSI